MPEKTTHPVQSIAKANPYDLFDFFKRTPDLVCIAGRDGYFRQVNPSVIQKLGYPEEEIYSRPIFSFLHPDDLSITRSTREKMLEGESLINFQNRYITKQGQVIWLEWTSVFVPEHEVVFAIAKDITARKGIEQQVEMEHRAYRGLAAHLKSTMEKDRKFVATELHEELAQLMLALKINIDWVRKEENNLGEKSRERMEEAHRISEMLISTVRRISFAMSPHMIEDLGLNSTLEWHCREFTVLHGIPCHYFSSLDTTSFNKETQIDLFRICQAALDNVRQHAKASSVSVKLEGSPKQFKLAISDNGIGFESSGTRYGHGLQVIYTRATSINASVQLTSDRDHGTELVIESSEDNLII